MGTAQYLAGKVLDGTDWSVGKGEPIKQYREEPVYAVTTTKQFKAKDSSDNNITIPKNKLILVFYSVVQNHESYF
jgi:hypothetical protein